MGGKNHQPCNHYLGESTTLSRNISLAHARLELGNVVLEDIILSELGGKRGSTKLLIKRLHSSCDHIQKALVDCEKLRQKMKENNFVDLPTLATSDLNEIGNNLIQMGMVNGSHWTHISDLMGKGGFRSVLSFFEQCLNDLLSKTRTLITCIEEIKTSMEAGLTNVIMEENREGNIKIAFAVLYQKWNEFEQHFMASSMLSTELWYRYKNHSSIYEGVLKENTISA
jgi:hypothetical protein